jgi:repressor LexA
MTLGDRLRTARENKGWSQVYVAGVLGMATSQTLSNYERGARDPDTETLTKLADLYCVTTDYLLGRTPDSNIDIRMPKVPIENSNNGPMDIPLAKEYHHNTSDFDRKRDEILDDLDSLHNFIKEVSGKYSAQQDDPDSKYFEPHKHIPLLGSIRAGNPAYAEEDVEELIVVSKKSKVDFALRVKGNSMIGAGILDGDLALCQKTSRAEPGDIVVALVNGDEAALKRIYYEEGGWILRSEHPDYPEIIMNEDEDRILGILLDIHRSRHNLRLISPDDAKMLDAMQKLRRMSEKRRNQSYEMIDLLSDED